MNTTIVLERLGVLPSENPALYVIAKAYDAAVVRADEHLSHLRERAVASGNPRSIATCITGGYSLQSEANAY